jgi:hypothetical protein
MPRPKNRWSLGLAQPELTISMRFVPKAEASERSPSDKLVGPAAVSEDQRRALRRSLAILREKNAMEARLKQERWFS